MFNRLRIMFERYQARRELRRKGIINPRRLVDWDSFANTIDRSPAPAVFILVMVWVVSSVLMTLSALQQNIDPGWVIGQEATRTLHSSCDFNYVDQEELDRSRMAAMERARKASSGRPACSHWRMLSRQTLAAKALSFIFFLMLLTSMPS